MTKPIRLSVKALLFDSAGRCLVLQRSLASKANAGKWDLPGGKVDPGEEIEAALRREIAEETGLVVSVGSLAGHAESESPNTRIVYLIFRCEVCGGKFGMSSEHAAGLWVLPREFGEIDLCPQFVEIARSFR